VDVTRKSILENYDAVRIPRIEQTRESGILAWTIKEFALANFNYSTGFDRDALGKRAMRKKNMT